ncbi:MAG: magnesium/cobalt transporter CorA [Planctomycetes bacterium]|nr:magnesium/cobalt transporter CorA [Planctomycetota bacterium]
MTETEPAQHLPRRAATRILRPQVGDEPGAVAQDAAGAPTHLRVMDFSPTQVEERQDVQPEGLPDYLQRQSVTWVDIEGFKAVEQIKRVGELLRLHPLMLADALNVPQRAKTEQYPEYMFVILHSPKSCEQELATEQVSVVFNDKFVLSFQEQDDLDSFAPVRERIRHNRGIVRNRGTAYLAYCLLDVVTDHFFPLLEKLETRLEAMEQRILKGELDVLAELYNLRHLCMDADRVIRANRDALSSLLNHSSEAIPADVRTYIRDVADHAMRQDQTAQALSDFAHSLRELHASAQATRMNEIIKVLTMVSTVFIPLSFFAGVYGMNFHTDQSGNMPELGMPYGYFIWWGCMVLLVLAMVGFFRAKGWLWARNR